ncbi:MAG: response regulator [Cyanobacteria bacterium P01_F01_bin.86]
MRVRDMLPQGNFEVIEATDGVEGLDAIRNQRPNLIMLDFLLPRMSGWEVFQEIQASPELQKIPLVLMSGRREEVTEKIQGPFEYFEFIQKPFEQKELIEAIKASMVKARKVRPQSSVASPAAAAASGNSDAEIAALKQQVATLQKEVAMLKNQTAKILAFIKQKLR